MKKLFRTITKEVTTKNESRIIDFDLLREKYDIDFSAENNSYSIVESKIVNSLTYSNDYILISAKSKSLLIARVCITNCKKAKLKKAEKVHKDFHVIADVMMSENASEEVKKKHEKHVQSLAKKELLKNQLAIAQNEFDIEDSLLPEKNAVEAAAFNELRLILINDSVKTEQDKLNIQALYLEQFENTAKENSIYVDYTRHLSHTIFNEKITEKNVEYLKQFAFSYAMNFISFTLKNCVKLYSEIYIDFAVN